MINAIPKFYFVKKKKLSILLKLFYNLQKKNLSQRLVSGHKFNPPTRVFDFIQIRFREETYDR